MRRARNRIRKVARTRRGVRRSIIYLLLLVCLLVRCGGSSSSHLPAPYNDVVTAVTITTSVSRTPAAMLPKNRWGRRLRHGGGRDGNLVVPAWMRLPHDEAAGTTTISTATTSELLTTTTTIDGTSGDPDDTPDNDNEEQPPKQQRRQLPAMEEQMMGGIIVLVLLFLLLTCCCRGFLCDLLACVCLYDLCCDGPPVADIGSAAFNLC